MALEIERRFLVSRVPGGIRSVHKITQGYLTSPGEQSVVRVRLAESEFSKGAFLTVKVPVSAGTNKEFEYEIEYADAVEMLAACNNRVLTKTRYYDLYQGHMFEIDVFEGALDGVVIAEVELPSIDAEVQLPDYLGTEITHIKGLSNFNFATKPEESLEILKSVI